jgi:hypothetical protein
MTEDGRRWLAAQPLPAAAREQIQVALSMIDALDRQLAPLDKALRAYARRQAGCKVLMGQFGVAELTAVTILAELGDARRFSSSRDAVRYAGLDITVHQSDQRRAAGHLSRQGPPALRWALFEATMCAARPCSPDHEYYSQAAGAARLQPGAPVCGAQAPEAQLPLAARARRGGAPTRMTLLVRAKLFLTQMRRGRLHARSRRHHHSLVVDGPYRPSGRNACPSGITQPPIMSPARSQPWSRTEIRPSARAHTSRTVERAHAPPAAPDRSYINAQAALVAADSRHS